MGEVVDVTVQAGEKAASVRYTLTVNGKTVFANQTKVEKKSLNGVIS